MPAARTCMVCSRRPAAALYVDDRHWYLIACDDPRCISPPLTTPYTRVMPYAVFMRLRGLMSDSSQREAIAGLIQRQGRVWQRGKHSINR